MKRLLICFLIIAALSSCNAFQKTADTALTKNEIIFDPNVYSRFLEDIQKLDSQYIYDDNQVVNRGNHLIYGNWTVYFETLGEDGPSKIYIQSKSGEHSFVTDIEQKIRMIGSSIAGVTELVISVHDPQNQDALIHYLFDLETRTLKLMDRPDNG